MSIGIKYDIFNATCILGYTSSYLNTQVKQLNIIRIIIELESARTLLVLLARVWMVTIL